MTRLVRTPLVSARGLEGEPLRSTAKNYRHKYSLEIRNGIPLPYPRMLPKLRSSIVMTETQTPPKKDETKADVTPEVKGENYTYASLILNEDFVDLVNNLGNLFEVNSFSKTKGIPALQYFHDEMNGESLPAFLEACIESPDVITSIPAPQKTLGTEKFSVNFKDIPAIVMHAESLYACLDAFRTICGYVPEKKSKTVKSLTMETLSTVKTPAKS